MVSLLNRGEINFLDKLSKDAPFESGTKLSRTQILRSLVEVSRNLNIEIKHINSGKELTKELIEVMREKTGSAR